MNKWRKSKINNRWVMSRVNGRCIEVREMKFWEKIILKTVFNKRFRWWLEGTVDNEWPKLVSWIKQINPNTTLK